MKKIFLLIILPITLIGACLAPNKEGSNKAEITSVSIEDRLAKYTPFRLEADLSHLSDPQKQVLTKLIEAAKIMDRLFWYEAYGPNWESFLQELPNDAYRQFAQINYGPYDRLDGNAPFVTGVEPKPAGANFYPTDMSKEEFETAELAKKSDLYTFVRRNEAGELTTLPYYEAFAEEVSQASKLLLEAAELAENTSFKRYLTLRAAALINDSYQPSDLAWMDVKDNALDLVIGPIETYEDQLFGYKAAHEAYVLIKDQAWSQRLTKYAQFLPELQENLPVDDPFKQEKPGTDADLNAYDVVYYAGDCNAGSKTIAINLPNDEEVQLEKGTRRLQLKNAMQAKFDKILLPISAQLIDESQRSYITFDAFFANTMFHEVAHGLGIKNVIGQEMTVREALKENASAIEEGKADILGLYMIQQLHEKGEVEGDLMNYYVTFMAGIFRSVRFGASSAHGKANMIRFNFFQEVGAFVKDEAKGTYRIDVPKFEAAVKSLSKQILTLQGEGDYAKAQRLVQEKAVIQADLQADLDRLAQAGIPVDIIFEQGPSVLNLE